jgi:hypothetical protein
MKFIFLTLLLSHLSFGQPIFPGTPGHPIKRSGGGLDQPGVSIVPGDQPKITKYTIHVVLSEVRPWQSSDGKTLEGKLIAFEDVTMEAPTDGAPPPAPAAPKNPTLVRDGKVRLMIGKTAFEIPLTRLSADDQAFIEEKRLAMEKKAKANP